MNREPLVQRVQREALALTTRRHFLSQSAAGLGSIWLATQTGFAKNLTPQHSETNPLSPLEPPLPAKVKRVIYLHMVGAPSQLELFDYKPDLNSLDGKDCPESFLEGKRFAFINGTPKMLGHQYKFQQHG